MHSLPAAMLRRSIGADTTTRQLKDPNTLSNYNDWRTSHITVNFDVDFEKKRLAGNVVLRMKSLTEAQSKEVVLDSSYLDIASMNINSKPAQYKLAPRLEPYGSALSIYLESSVPKDTEIEVDVRLATTANCTALQWLTPAQTSNKKHPYMFSQCQAIHARSICPLQDTPDVKAPVEYNIRSPLPVLASGLPTGSRDYKPPTTKGGRGTLLYTFRQDNPIPAYLLAIASGDIACASIGVRSTVWTGPEELVGCKWELEEDMEKFLDAAESLVYPYAWGTYNVLVLPPSFPYGGLEVPVFTFATPTIISGDRQNVDVIAHELAHSWSGNLVTNASWEHFWLNEGWTTYLERRIQAEIHGEAHRGFSAIIGWKALQDSVERLGQDHEFTKLIDDLKGKDPDDAFSSVPYEKGFVFLYHLEHLIGKEKWDEFIPHYFTVFKNQSLDSYDFKSALLSFFASDAAATEALTDLDWDTWFYAPGYPPKPDFDSSLATPCYALADKWAHIATAPFTPSAADITGWTANQSVVFLEALQNFDEPLRPADAEALGAAYGYSNSLNVELVSRFYSIGLMARWEGCYEPTARLLGTVGRMKFVRPLFVLLNKCDRELAVKTFRENEGFYHPICRAMVEKDLFGEGKEV